MVTFNEKDRYLRAVLEHNRPFLDDLFVYDDRSTDGTYDICREYAQVAQRAPENRNFASHEGQFRTDAWEAFNLLLEPVDGDIVVVFDADEFFMGDPRCFSNGYVGRVRIHEGWRYVEGTLWERVDKAWGKIDGLRVYRWHPRFLDDAHRAMDRRPTASGVGPHYRTAPHAGFELLHVGYVRDEDKKAKYARYTADRGHGSLHVQSILTGTPSLLEVRWPSGPAEDALPTIVETALSASTAPAPAVTDP